MLSSSSRLVLYIEKSEDLCVFLFGFSFIRLFKRNSCIFEDFYSISLGAYPEDFSALSVFTYIWAKDANKWHTQEAINKENCGTP